MAKLYKVVCGPYKGKLGHIAYEWAGERVSFRFGAENCWNGEVIVDTVYLEDL